MKKNCILAFTPGGFRFYFLSLFSFFASVSIYARTVTGTVTDEVNKPHFGVTVTAKGTDKATNTNSSGDFSINSTGKDASVVSFIGFVRLEIPLNGRTTISVSRIRGEATIGDDMIVVALGVKRESRKLGYSATSVSTDEQIKNRTTNGGEALEGRVAGLNFTPPAAGAGTSNQIRLRGQIGFAGTTNSPLLVINGLPVDQEARTITLPLQLLVEINYHPEYFGIRLS